MRIVNVTQWWCFQSLVTMRIVNVTQWCFQSLDNECFQSLSDNEDSKCHSVVVFPVLSDNEDSKCHSVVVFPVFK